MAADEEIHELIRANGFSNLIDFSSIILRHFSRPPADYGRKECVDALRHLVNAVEWPTPASNLKAIAKKARAVLAKHT